MPFTYHCKDTGFDCDEHLENEEEEKLRAEALEHLKTRHPDEALEQDKAEGLLIAGMKPA